jgi:hypothetical protein
MASAVIVTLVALPLLLLVGNIVGAIRARDWRQPTEPGRSWAP